MNRATKSNELVQPLLVQRRRSLLDSIEKSWSIGIYVGDSPFSFQPAGKPENPVLTRDDVLDIPASFVADPFMIRAGEMWHMFFEAKNIVTRMGEIGLALSRDGLHWTYSQIVLREAFHLSYPYVFEAEGEYYMIPETLGANQLRLYRADRFPFDWSHVADLMEGQFADASVVLFDKRWWIFSCTRPFEHDVLRLFSSDSLFGLYVEHPRSPIVACDPHVARPAGRVQLFNRGLIRYAQDCYPKYGTRVSAFEISELTTNSYQESRFVHSVLEPGSQHWNRVGMHHIDPHLNDDGSWIACTDGRCATDAE